MFIDPEELICAADTARLLNVAEQTLSAWRHYGRGPTYCKIGRRAYYRRDDIRAWLGQQMHSTSQKPEAA